MGQGYEQSQSTPTTEQTPVPGVAGAGAGNAAAAATLQSGQRQTRVPGVWLVSDPSHYQDTVLQRLPQGTILDVVGQGAGERFNRADSRHHWWQVSLPDGGSGWVMQTLLESSQATQEGLAGEVLGESDQGEVCEPWVELARGAVVSDTLEAQRRTALEDVAGRWCVIFDTSWVFQTVLDTGTQCVPILALHWQDSWGARPAHEPLTADARELDARLCLAALSIEPGWDGLGDATRTQLEAYLGGETNDQSDRARDTLITFFMDPGWGSQPAEAQAALLEGLLTDSATRVGVTNGDGREGTAVDFTLTGPTLVNDHAFKDTTADADLYQAVFDGQSIPIYAPHAPDAAQGHFHSAQQAAEGLATLPQASRALVTQVSLEPIQNASDAYWATEYNSPGFRSYMTAGATGVINIYPRARPVDDAQQIVMNNSMVHETGHTWAHQTWGADHTADAWAPWRDAMASDVVSVSNYATNSPAEDVSETLVVYSMSQGTPEFDELRAMVPARFAILDRHF